MAQQVLTLNLKDQGGVDMPDGTAVDWSLDDGSKGSLASAQTAVAGGAGNATNTYTANAGAVGTVTVTGAAHAVPAVQDTCILTLIAGDGPSAAMLGLISAFGDANVRAIYDMRDASNAKLVGSTITISDPRGMPDVPALTGSVSASAFSGAGNARALTLAANEMLRTAAASCFSLDTDCLALVFYQKDPIASGANAKLLEVAGGAGAFSVTQRTTPSNDLLNFIDEVSGGTSADTATALAGQVREMWVGKAQGATNGLVNAVFKLPTHGDFNFTTLSGHAPPAFTVGNLLALNGSAAGAAATTACLYACVVLLTVRPKDITTAQGTAIAALSAEIGAVRL